MSPADIDPWILAHPVASVLPFTLLLFAIAVLPLVKEHWWEKNRHKAVVSLVLAAPVGMALLMRQPEALAHTLHEYVSFIALLASLYTVSGGLYFRGRLACTPAANTALLAFGAGLANIVGTTGASMLLIRPLLSANARRDHTTHIVIFFIVVVSNAGGLLTPMGDPPLFLGYLRGVPFFWTLTTLWPFWLISIGYLLALFYAIDRRFYAREPVQEHPETNEPMHLVGKRNFYLIGVILFAVFQPSPWREGLMLAAAAVSYKLSPQAAHESNRFTFVAIQEVAILFFGIFVTMVPALQLLAARSPHIGLTQPWQFFWLTGILSSFLDNAPTYLTFFSVAGGLPPSGTLVAGVAEPLLVAISLGAVLMGANSYIGNGPNFMVKTIAERYHVRPLPHFFGYMAWSFGILLPLYGILTVWILALN